MDFGVEALSALVMVIIIDVVLAGDNAVVVGMAAARLPTEQRRKAIFYGIVAATVLRILLAGVATQLLAIVGLTLAGGVLLLWVVWKMYRDLRPAAGKAEDEAGKPVKEADRFHQALLQIVLADVSMSLYNVLAVAGTAKDHFWILVVGLILSVGLMGLASTFVAKLLAKHHWVAWVGLVIVAFVAFRMIYEGSHEVIRATGIAG